GAPGAARHLPLARAPQLSGRGARVRGRAARLRGLAYGARRVAARRAGAVGAHSRGGAGAPRRRAAGALKKTDPAPRERRRVETAKVDYRKRAFRLPHDAWFTGVGFTDSRNSSASQKSSSPPANGVSSQANHHEPELRPVPA